MHRMSGKPNSLAWARRWSSPGRRVCCGAVGLLAVAAGCHAPLDDIQVVLNRHKRAVEKLPEEERSRLMPYGDPVVSEVSVGLLPTDLLDVDTARAIAVRANPDIHAAQARLEQAAARIAEARSRYYPTLVWTHNSSRTFQTPASRNRLNTTLQPAQPVPADISTNTLAVTTLINALRRPLFGVPTAKGNRNPFSEHSTSMTATWTVFDGFIREAQMLATKHVYKASWSALQDVERLLVQAVDSAYFQVQLAQEQIRIARADEGFSQEQFVETKKLHAAGRATSADVDNFRVRVLEAQAEVTAALGRRETGRVVLGELLGLPDATLPDDLRLSPLADETAQEMTEPDPDIWIERALADRPDVRQLEHLLDNDEEQVRSARGAFQPTIIASGSWGFDRSSNVRYSREDQSTAAAIEFRWELFTGGARSARLRIAEAVSAEIAATLKRLKLKVQSDVRTAIISLHDAQQQVILRREAVETARENRRIVQIGYVAGKETLNRLNEAQRDFITAEANLALARIRIRQAWSDLRAAAARYNADSRDRPVDVDAPR